MMSVAQMKSTQHLLTLGDLLWVRTVTREYQARMQTPVRNSDSIAIDFGPMLEEVQRTLEMVDQRIKELNYKEHN